MPNAAEIVLWYPTRKYDALQRALKDTGTDLKAELTGVLDMLYERHIPEAERKEIYAAMEQEEQAAARQAAENQRISVIRVVYLHRRWEWKLISVVDTLHLARSLRTALQQSESVTVDAFLVRLGEKETISPEEYEGMSIAKIQNSSHVTTACYLDFDQQIMSIATPGEGWCSYRMKDISTAIYQADRKKYITARQTMERFHNALQGKRLLTDPAPAAPISAGT